MLCYGYGVKTLCENTLECASAEVAHGGSICSPKTAVDRCVQDWYISFCLCFHRQTSVLLHLVFELPKPIERTYKSKLHFYVKMGSMYCRLPDLSLFKVDSVRAYYVNLEASPPSEGKTVFLPISWSWWENIQIRNQSSFLFFMHCNSFNARITRVPPLSC